MIAKGTIAIRAKGGASPLARERAHQASRQCVSNGPLPLMANPFAFASMGTRDARRRIAGSSMYAVCRVRPREKPVVASAQPPCTKARRIDTPRVLSGVTPRPGSAFLCHRSLRSPAYPSPTRRPLRSIYQSPAQTMLSHMFHDLCQAMWFSKFPCPVFSPGRDGVASIRAHFPGYLCWLNFSSWQCYAFQGCACIISSCKCKLKMKKTRLTKLTLPIPIVKNICDFNYVECEKCFFIKKCKASFT